MGRAQGCIVLTACCGFACAMGRAQGCFCLPPYRFAEMGAELRAVFVSTARCAGISTQAVAWRAAMTVPYPQPAPPEWAPQSSLWVGWPRLREEWGEAFDAARAEIAGFAALASRFVRVRMAAGDDQAAAAARAVLPAPVEVHRVPCGDIWLRDTGPLFRRAPDGELRADCFRFNGWGGKYVMPGDTETGPALAGVEGAGVHSHAFILEGGAVEHDGAGTVITTRECLLADNRNPGWSEADAEAALQVAFGARRVIWLERGLLNDHTDGHVDNLARFCGPGRVLCQTPQGDDDRNGERLGEIEDTLRSAGLDVVTLASPGPVRDEGGAIVPASHMNFVITNAAVIVPDYGRARETGVAQVLAEAFPGRPVHLLGARAILSGGGSFHCMTCQVPAPDKTPDSEE